MQSLNALSLAPDVIHWLENSHSPRILHVFDQACNLINERREVFSIVTPQIGNGPFNLVVEDGISFSEQIDVQSSVSIVGNQIVLNDWTINTANAKLWNPRPDWEKLHISRDNISNRLMKLSITDDPFSITLFSALIDADLSACVAAAKRLAGLGAGLTPTGDDFLMGAIYAGWIIHPPEVASVLAQQIAETAVPLTTSLSAAWLRSAGKGEAGILWHQFFDALISVGRIGDPTYAMNKILAIGETSGADALAGFRGVFRCRAQDRLNLKEYNQT